MLEWAALFGAPLAIERHSLAALSQRKAGDADRVKVAAVAHVSRPAES